MFHVKHAPVQKTAPAFRTTLHQLVNLWVDDLHRQGTSQVCRRAITIPVYLYLQTLA